MKRQTRFVFLVMSVYLVCLIEHAFSQNRFWEPTQGPFGGSFRLFAINSRGDIFIGTGISIFRSTDHGATWTEVYENFFTISALAIDHNGEFWIGLHGTDGFGGGLFRYRESGGSWMEVYAGLQPMDVRGIFINPLGHLFVNTLDHGVFRSTDYGNSWTPIMTGIPSPAVLAIAPNGRLFGLTNSGLMFSLDNGDTWKMNSLRMFGLHSLAFNSAGHIFASALNVIYRSTNEGETWSRVDSTFRRSYGDFAFATSGEIFVSSNQGIFLSPDEGTTWRPTGLGEFELEIGKLGIDTQDQLFASLSGGGIFRSKDKGETWVAGGLGPVEVLSLMFNGNGQLLAGGRGGNIFLFAKQNDGEQIWLPLYTRGYRVSGSIFAFATNARGEIFAGATRSFGYRGGVYRSTDGRRWHALTNGMISTSVRALVFNANGHLLAGTRDGGVYISPDNGDHWMPGNTGMMTADIRALAVNAHGHVFAGTQNQGMFRSFDHGAAWSPANTGLADTTVHALVINSRQHLFAGTSSGVSRSTDNGETWQAISAGQIDHPVHCFAITPNDHIFAGTVAGVYRSVDNGDYWQSVSDGMPDRGSVQALVIDADGYLFAGTPTGVFRSVQAATQVGETFTEAPQTFQLAQNYPNPFNPSTTIRFFLPTREHVTLKVFDVNGREVATLAEGVLNTGEHAVVFTAKNLASGLYYYRLQAGQNVYQKTMGLVK